MLLKLWTTHNMWRTSLVPLALDLQKLRKDLGFPGGSDGKEFACNAGGLGSIPGQEDPLEKEMATHSSILAWKIPWTEEPGGLQSMGSQRVRHDWATNLSLTDLIEKTSLPLGPREIPLLPNSLDSQYSNHSNHFRLSFLYVGIWYCSLKTFLRDSNLTTEKESDHKTRC